MAHAHATERYRVNWTGGGNNAARLATLTDEGSLDVPVAGWLGTAFTFLSTGSAAGAKCITLKIIDYTMLEGYVMSAALRAESVTFVIHPHRTARLLQAIDVRGGGLPETRRDTQTRARRARISCRASRLYRTRTVSWTPRMCSGNQDQAWTLGFSVLR